jgi:hypothetical protein
MRLIAGLFVSMITTVPASAAVVYSYTGAPYTLDRSDTLAVELGANLTGEVRLDAPLPAGETRFTSVFPGFEGSLPTFSFTSGEVTITDQSPDLYVADLQLTADAGGDIVGWNIALQRRRITDGVTFAFELESSTRDVASAFSCEGLETATAITCASFDGLLASRSENFATGGWSTTVLPDEPAVIPLPAAGALLVTALASLAAYRRPRATAT